MRVHGTEALVAGLRAGGHLDEGWTPAFRAVDRGAFVPERVWLRGEGGYWTLTHEAEPATWRRAVYSDTAVVTQVEGSGDPAMVPTSSASMPRVVARMLEVLDVRAGNRVLEAGTGTGYNAALLAHRLGDAHVTSVETDPLLAEAARAALKDAGFAPTVVTGDADRGHAAGAPYDRVIATYAVHDIPYAWVRHTRPGGALVLPWGTGLFNGVLVRLTVRGGPGGSPVAEGRVVDDTAFMWDRTQAPARDVMATVRGAAAAAARVSRTPLDPRAVLGDDDMAFTAGVLVPDTRYSVGHGPDGEFTLWIADAASGSWASVDYVPGDTEFELQQYGPRALWDEVGTAYAWWHTAGSPARTRYGLTVGPGPTRVWLDHPHQHVTTRAGGRGSAGTRGGVRRGRSGGVCPVGRCSRGLGGCWSGGC